MKVVQKTNWYRFVSYDEYHEPAPVCVIREQFKFHRSQQYSMGKTIHRVERAGLKIGHQTSG